MSILDNNSLYKEHMNNLMNWEASDEIKKVIASVGLKYLGDGFFGDMSAKHFMITPISFMRKQYKVTAWDNNDIYSSNTMHFDDIKSFLTRSL